MRLLPEPYAPMVSYIAEQGVKAQYRYSANLFGVALFGVMIGKKPTGGHWNSGIAILRNNGLIETAGKSYRIGALFR